MRLWHILSRLRQVLYPVGKQRERKTDHTEPSLRERRTIEDMSSAIISVCKIATEIGWHRATVYREIKRNLLVDDELPKLNGYYRVSAQRTAVNRSRARPAGWPAHWTGRRSG